mgnify:CR=1 FL=1
MSRVLSTSKKKWSILLNKLKQLKSSKSLTFFKDNSLQTRFKTFLKISLQSCFSRTFMTKRLHISQILWTKSILNFRIFWLRWITESWRFKNKSRRNWKDNDKFKRENNFRNKDRRKNKKWWNRCKKWKNWRRKCIKWDSRVITWLTVWVKQWTIWTT